MNEPIRCDNIRNNDKNYVQKENYIENDQLTWESTNEPIRSSRHINHPIGGEEYLHSNNDNNSVKAHC